MATTPPGAIKPPVLPTPDIQTIKAAVSFKTGDIPPTQYLYVQDGEQLAVVWMSNATGQTLRVNYRYLVPNGEIKEGQLNTPASVGGAIQNVLLPVAEGWLISVAFQQLGNIGSNQWAFAQLLLLRSAVGGAPNYGLIWQGYVPFNVSNGWPGTTAKEISDGGGTIRSVSGTTPAAGAEINEVVPTGKRWQLLSFKTIFTASAAVATRTISLVVDDGANILFGVTQVPTYSAGQSNTIIWSTMGVQTQVLSSFNNNPIPVPTFLKQGYRVRTSTANLQAGDQYGTPQYLVMEWGLWDA